MSAIGHGQSRCRRALGCACALALAACSSIDGPSPVLIPNRALDVSSSLSIPAEGIALAAVVFIAVDPLAPNWRVESLDLGGGRYAIALTKKRFTTGGDGESRQVLRRRAEQIARDQGFRSYDLLEYTEGIESNVPIAQRVSRAVVQFK